MNHECKDYYRYHPLDSDTSALRLTELLPGHWDDPIRCNLEHTSLDVRPQYEALSYMWGDKSSTTIISLCGDAVRITKSLELALRYLRRADSSRILWIDALCINQTSITEKNQKVPEMWRVFSHAKKVVSWLGESDEDSEAAFDSVLALEMARDRTAAENTNRDYGNPSIIPIMGSPGAGKSSFINIGDRADTASASRYKSKYVTTIKYKPTRHAMAIDYETTYTGVAYANLSEDGAAAEVINIADWGLGMNNASKVPTVISYSAPNELDTWGSSLSNDAIAMCNSKLQLDVQESKLDELDATLAVLEGMKNLDFSDQLIGSGDLHSYNWSSILKLLSRPYFGRVWVVQELFYAGHIFNDQEDRCVFMCGDRTLPRPFLFRTWQLLEGIEVTKESYEQHGHAWLFGQTNGLSEPLKTLVSHGTLHGQPNAPEIFNVLRDASIEGKDRLSRLITSTMSFQATDPRDKVYALLKMAGVSNEDFPVDYSLPTNQVLRAITIYAIRTSQSLRILEGNRRSTDTVNPSWIPDPSVLPVRSIEWTHHNRFASRGAPLACEYIESTGLLHLQGIIVGRVKTKIGPFSFGRGFTEEALSPLKDFYRTLDISRRDKFWRTLVMDLDRTNALQRPNNYPAPAEFGTMCDTLLGTTAEPDEEASHDHEKRNLQSISLYLTNMYDSAQKRCFIELDSGCMGLGPYDAIPGDMIVILFGGDVCFTLRPKGDCYQLVGDCYVYGVMQGQMMRQEDSAYLSGKQEFLLC